MNKNKLILKYFQKSDLLTIKNKKYCNSITSFFKWLVENDKVHNDRTTKFLSFSSRHNPEPEQVRFIVAPYRASPWYWGKAQIICHDDTILAGIEELSFLLSNHTKLIFKPLAKDGEKAIKGKILAEIEGNASEILAYERTILNILQRLSGIATATNRLIKLINPSSRVYHLSSIIHHPFITATRKTPWMLLDKKAVSVGGGLTHRLSLSDGIIIKDNHLIAIKNEHKLETIEEAISKALEIVLRKAKGELIEIEVRTEKEALSALQAFQKYNINNHLAIMFDNFSPLSVRSIISNLSNLYDLSSIIIEASGGIDKNNICQWATNGLDLISIGSLTHSPSATNISLEF